MSRFNDKVVRNFLKAAAIAFALGVEAVPAQAGVTEPLPPAGGQGSSPEAGDDARASATAVPPAARRRSGSEAA